MRSKTITTLTLFLSALALMFFHNTALDLNWYYFYPWADIPMHILGGFAVGLLVYTVLVSGLATDKSPHQTSSRVFFVTVFGTFLVSVIWEVLELVLFLTKDAGLSTETLSDVVFGVVGSILAWGVVILISRKKSSTISNQQ